MAWRVDARALGRRAEPDVSAAASYAPSQNSRFVGNMAHKLG